MVSRTAMLNTGRRLHSAAMKQGRLCSVPVQGLARPQAPCHFRTQRLLGAHALGHTTRSLTLEHSHARVAANFLETSRRTIVPSTASVPNTRLRVAVDVDEVLGRFVFALNKFCEAEYGMRHEVSDYWVYEFAKIWNCSQDHSNHIVHEFFESQHFQDGIPIIPGAYQALDRVRHSCDLVVVTSRQHVIMDQTLDWIDRHYKGLFQEVYFGNHWALSGVSKKKSDICRSVGAQVLIDDNPTYATECAHAGINVLLFDWDHGYPWSKLKQGQHHPLIRVVRNWEEVEQQLGLLAEQLQLTESSSSNGSSSSSTSSLPSSAIQQ